VLLRRPPDRPRSRAACCLPGALLDPGIGARIRVSLRLRLDWSRSAGTRMRTRLPTPYRPKAAARTGYKHPAGIFQAPRAPPRSTAALGPDVFRVRGRHTTDRRAG